MFKDRATSSPFLIRDMPGEMSFVPQISDEAILVVDENNIQIKATIKSEENGNYIGEIISYHTEISKRTPAERLEQIQECEAFITENNLINGSEISFTEIKIHALSR